MNDRTKPTYLICVDSDGCAVDSMTIKHKRAFGPAFVEIFQLHAFEKELLNEWNCINLYSLDRGINRFQGLAKIVAYTEKHFQEIEDAKFLLQAVQEAPELNVSVFENHYLETGKMIFKQAIDYSNRVNQLIEAIPENEITTFDYVADSLKKASTFGKIVVVSSANKAAVEEEWHRLALSPYVDQFFTQEDGTKSQIIAHLKKEGGYEQHQILKIGDAIGDYEAAKVNQVAFYPILVNQESTSWQRLLDHYFSIFVSGDFNNVRHELNQGFLENLTKGEQV